MTGSILTVSRNNLHLTKRAVASATAQDTPCDVLVIDNCSSDGTQQWLRSKRGISYLFMQQQASLAACWNLGLNTLWCNSYAPVLVINNDTELRRDTYREIRQYKLRRKEVAMVTGISVRSIEEMEALIPEQFTEQPHPDFSCYLISQPIFKVVGPFDEEYFPAYAEDSDYHLRMHRAGIAAVSIDFPFLHHAAQTLKAANPAESTKIRRGADLNRRRFFAKYRVQVGSPEYYSLFTSSPLVDHKSHSET